MKEKFKYAYMDCAERFAQLSTANRKKVGAIIVKDNRIISIGYNGMPSGWTNDCETTDEYGNCPMTKPEVLHAETNAIAKVARSSESCQDSILFTTVSPCLECAKLIYQAGIFHVIWKEEYRSDAGLKFLEQCGCTLEQLT